MKEETNYCFLFYSWFYSKKSEEADMYVGVDMIGMVKSIRNYYSRSPLIFLQGV